jgi:hypothetical protein
MKKAVHMCTVRIISVQNCISLLNAAFHNTVFVHAQGQLTLLNKQCYQDMAACVRCLSEGLVVSRGLEWVNKFVGGLSKDILGSLCHPNSHIILNISSPAAALKNGLNMEELSRHGKPVSVMCFLKNT